LRERERERESTGHFVEKKGGIGFEWTLKMEEVKKRELKRFRKVVK
jgi:hypothetical protein